jgi:hypothetical protein
MGKKFRQEVSYVISELLQHTPLRNCLKFRCLTNNNINNRQQGKHRSEQEQINLKEKNHLHYLSLTQSITTMSCIDSPHRQKMMNFQWCDTDETLDRIESTV